MAVTLRRTATGLYLAGLALFVLAVYVGLVYFNNTIGAGAGFVTRMSLVNWVILFSVLLVLLLVALLILYFLPGQQEATEAEPSWEPLAAAEPASEPAPAMMDAEPMTETRLEPMARPDEAITEALLVRCTNCQTEFELPYSTQRPITGTCPNCHEDVILEEEEAVLGAGGEDVIEIEGIGPTNAEKLYEVGIRTTDQLAAASAERLAEQTGISLGQLTVWKSMADLMRIKGVGKQGAELLARAGVYSVDELAHESPSRLTKRLKTYLGTLERPPTKISPTEKRSKDWILAAKRLSGH